MNDLKFIFRASPAMALLCLACSMLHPISAKALSILGSVSVTIQPPEAITDGGRWSADGGVLQASGATVGNLDAGTHTIQFANLAARRDERCEKDAPAETQAVD